jgi:L-ascorbate metabolism protein UlaG (beta-lactamase superfamily)
LIEPALADDAFIEDVAAATDPERVYLWWLGQSGFLIAWRRHYLLIDPYLSDSLTRKYAGTDREHVRMTRRVVDPRALDFVDVVCSTHTHTDHLDAETLKPIMARGAALVCPAANRELAADRLGRAPDIVMSYGETATVAGFEVELVPAAHPELAPNTPATSWPAAARGSTTAATPWSTPEWPTAYDGEGRQSPCFRSTGRTAT